jgi:hypothetical protein
MQKNYRPNKSLFTLTNLGTADTRYAGAYCDKSKELDSTLKGFVEDKESKGRL